MAKFVMLFVAQTVPLVASLGRTGEKLVDMLSSGPFALRVLAFFGGM